MKLRIPKPLARLAHVGTFLTVVALQSASLAQAPPAEASSGAVQAYPIAAGDVAQLAAQLAERYARMPEVRIVGDARTRQIVVVAPAETQREIATWIADSARAGGPALAPANAAPATLPVAPAAAGSPALSAGPLTTQSFVLKNIAPQQLVGEVLRIWGTRIVATASVDGDATDLEFPPDTQARVRVEQRGRKVTLQTPEKTAKAWLRVLSTLDAPPRAAEQSQVVALDRADPATIVRAVSLIRAAAGGDEIDPLLAHRKGHIGQFVSMIFQPEGGAQPAPLPPAAPMPPPAAEPMPPAAEEEDTGKIGNVRIEIIEGLDQIIVIGKKKDVDRVLKIIAEIEQQSQENRPAVEIYALKHVDGEALGALITTIYPDVFGARQGRVTVTPLLKPNALLLIGRAENLPPVIELIQKLDRPTPPNSQVRVFNLKHMSSIDAERTVRSFFVVRPGVTNDPRLGLGTRVLVIADFRSNSLIVQAAPRDMLEVAKLIEQLDVETAASTQEVKVFKLKNALAEELAPVLQEAITGIGAPGQQQQQQQQAAGGAGTPTPAQATRRATSLQLLRIDAGGQELLQSGILADMRITADSRGNSLIVIGPAKSMDLMRNLIEQLDELPATEAQIKVFTIINGDATALADMLQNLFGASQQGGGGQGPAGLQSATGGGDSALVPLRFSVDQRTNSIIASGTAGDLNVIYKILVRLDEGDIRQRVTTVYRLHNAPAADVALALNNLLTRQRDLNQAAPELVSPYEQIEREVIIEPEPVSNSLIVSATPRYFDEIRRVVTELDKRPPMVVIQVMIAEVTLQDTDQFGVELGLQDSLLFDRGLASNRYLWNGQPLGNDNSAASIAARNAVATQAITNFTLNRADPTLGFGGMVLQASSDSVNMLVRALQDSQRLQVISRPQVQTLDNQPAYVQVGAQVPRIQSSQITNFGTQNNTADIPVGIILQVTPRTSPDGMIVMEVAAEKSAVGPEATGIPISITTDGQVIRSPQILITRAQTTVSARGGQTVILGGLITNDQQEYTRRVPYLADVPVLGRLFRFDSVLKKRTELLIILTPFIMQSDEDIDAMNLRESERMSWCIGDVVNIHGEVGFGGSSAYNTQSSPLIFPDLNPSGPEPTPAPPAGSLPPQPLPMVPPPAAQPPAITLPPPAPMPPPIPGPSRPAPTASSPPGNSAGSPVPRPVAAQAISLPLPSLSNSLPGVPPRPLASPPAGLPPAVQAQALEPQHRGLQPPTIQPASPPPGTQADYRFATPPAGAIAPAMYVPTGR
ncbi:MAG: secretin N-terminal domain-containing protein [Pirellulaceae bacterium]|nr:secretin N-terminal domain-containing protein [Pirellulaceae bacterium]